MALTDHAAHHKDVGKIAQLEHRHFATIATIISQMPESAMVRASVADHFADALRATNPKFDRGRFLRACNHGG